MWTQTYEQQYPEQSINHQVKVLAFAVNCLSTGDFKQFKSLLKQSLELPNSTNSICVQIPDKPDTAVLTLRELDVLTLVANGYSRKEIGSSLTISENTAASHIASIYRKLEINSIAEATNIAIRDGLV